MNGDQWVCECLWYNLFVRKTCRHCGKPRPDDAQIVPFMATYAKEKEQKS